MSGGVVEYAFSRSHQEPNTGCWLWGGGTDRASIPMARLGGRTRSVRAAISEELGLDAGPGCSSVAKCGQVSCVNPDHIVVRKKNSHRISAWTADRIKRCSKRDGLGCWSWSLSLLNKRYGAASVEGHSESAHRLSFRVFKGAIPGDTCVLHS